MSERMLKPQVRFNPRPGFNPSETGGRIGNHRAWVVSIHARVLTRARRAAGWARRSWIAVSIHARVLTRARRKSHLG
uniref:Uncharacterized protein n=1 Tax=mine drainage metagenome TaxID=410659 RepID=E6PNE1_9ZZZZ